MRAETPERLSDYLIPFYRVQRDERPNVLIIMTDQQRWDTIRALGAPWMITPNLDRLAQEGCIFENACSGNPVCIPARHNLLTGLYSRSHGAAGNSSITLPPDMPRLPQLLADAGWHCESVGKMHFTPARTHHGLHRMQTQEELYRHIGDDDYALWLRDQGLGHLKYVHGIRNPLAQCPQRSQMDEAHHPTTWVGDRSVDMIHRNAERPFFLWSSFIHPHYPCAVPDSVADLYREADFPEPVPEQEDVAPRIAHARSNDMYDDPAKDRRQRELYYASVTLVDKQVGRMLDALEETGQLDNTLIVFCTDHGDMLGDHGAWNKSVPYDAARRIPFIIRHPGSFAPGSRYRGHVDLIDLLPTVCDLCDIDYRSPYPLPGESLLIPEGHGAKDRSVHYMENGRGSGRVISLRGMRHKYNYWFCDGREELFDLQEDPQERVNILHHQPDARQGAIAAELKGRLLQLERQWGHPESIIRQADNSHAFAVHGGSPEPDWPPCQRGLDFQMPMHYWNVPERERVAYQSELVEFRRAIAQEPTVDPQRVDWDFYISCGGDPAVPAAVRDGRF